MISRPCLSACLPHLAYPHTGSEQKRNTLVQAPGEAEFEGHSTAMRTHLLMPIPGSLRSHSGARKEGGPRSSTLSPSV